MRTPSTNLSSATHDLIASYGNTAKHVVNAYRTGGERMVGFFEQRWELAMEKSSPQLTAEVRHNATAAQQAFGSYCTRGLTFTTDGADALIEKLVNLTMGGVQQVATQADKFEDKTGVKALTQLATVTVPAVVAVNRLVTQLEQKTEALVAKIAGDSVVTPKPKRATAFKKARARKAV